MRDGLTPVEREVQREQLKAFRRASKGFARPRQWAAAIFDMSSPEDRRAALEMVPEEWRGWVLHYIQDWIARGLDEAKKKEQA